MPHALPDLPFGFDSLEPYIDEQTLRIHHGKHHNTYVTKLNDALADQAELAGKSLEELMLAVPSLPDNLKGPVRNNGGQHYNHSLYWQCMGPAGQGGDGPAGQLASAIQSTFGDLAKMKETFTKAAATCFGSGWAWLYVDQAGKLAITASSNEANPLTMGLTDTAAKHLLVVDVWEHAYYLRYQNRRPEYLDAWWNVVNWSAASQRFDAIAG